MKTKKTEIPVLSFSKGEKGKIVLPEAVFNAKINTALIAQAVRVFLSNQRKAFAKVKSRSEVSGSRIKVWKQKGTGRARHGDRYAPIFVGGGVTHGPKGDRNFKRTLPLKMKRLALFSVLTAKLKEEKVIVVDGLKSIDPKTRPAISRLKELTGIKEKESCLLVLPESWGNTKKAFRNAPFIDIFLADNINTYLVLNHRWLVFTPESINKLTDKVVKNG